MGRLDELDCVFKSRGVASFNLAPESYIDKHKVSHLYHKKAPCLLS